MRHFNMCLCTILLLWVTQLANAQSEVCNRCNIKLHYWVKDDSICRAVPNMPVFIGNNKQSSFLSYLLANLKFDKRDLIDVCDDRFIVSFVITSKGKLVRVKVNGKKRKNYTGAEKAIFRVLKKSPRWQPGDIDGIKVPVYLRMPIKIHCSSEAFD